MALLYCSKSRIENGGWKMAILNPRFSILDLPPFAILDLT